MGAYSPYLLVNSSVHAALGHSSPWLALLSAIPTLVRLGLRIFRLWPSFGGTSLKNDASIPSSCFLSKTGCGSSGITRGEVEVSPCSEVNQAFSATKSLPPASVYR